jgi:hypothetical protein
MHDIPEGSAGRGHGQVPSGNAPPRPPRPLVSLEQLLAMQNDLMKKLVENDERCGAERQQPHHQERDSFYTEFLATRRPVFVDATDPLEADNWLHTTESMFGLLHYIEYQKTLYGAQQLRGSATSWWATYTAALPTNHHVLWGESVLLSVLITYLWVCSIASLKNFWILSRGTIPCLTTPGSSTPWLNMAHIMSI